MTEFSRFGGTLPDEDTRTFSFEDGNGGVCKVTVWCEGRDRNPSTEAYHPVYAYSISTPDWEYHDNDIRGGANETPTLDAAAKSLFAFLYACQEGLPKDTDAEGENARLFPPHVREWAYMVNDELSLVYETITKGGTQGGKFI